MILGEPIILGGGGGIACVVIITTDPSAVVTCSLGNTSISKTANADGKAVFELKKAGVWTITASLNGETVSEEIDTNLALETEISFANPILENNTWEQISKVARSGKASTIWNVGDTKTFICNGETYKAQIIGFNHDDVADSTAYGREKAGITFQFKELTSQGSSMNIVGQETKSWADSLLRTLFQNYVTNKTIEESLLNVIVSVNKLYEPTYSTVETCVDTLFLLSEPELTGAVSVGANDTGEQYAFYASGNSRVKYAIGTTTKYSHWTRSRKKSSTTDFVYIYSEGDIATMKSSSAAHLFAPAFCV